MQVTETLTEGLKREFKVVVPAAELDERLSTRLTSMKDEVRIKGTGRLEEVYGEGWPTQNEWADAVAKISQMKVDFVAGISTTGAVIVAGTLDVAALGEILSDPTTTTLHRSAEATS